MSLSEELAAIVRAAVAEALDQKLTELVPGKPQLLTRDEAAEVLRISPRQLDDLRRGANPPPECRVGCAPRFVAGELVEWARGRSWLRAQPTERRGACGE